MRFVEDIFSVIINKQIYICPVISVNNKICFQGNDVLAANGGISSLKFENQHTVSVLGDDTDDDCEGCLSLHPHPCCRRRPGR